MNSIFCNEKISSIELFDLTRKINIYFSLLIIIIGIAGNSLAVLVFIRKKFRRHSFSIYLLCLCISDGVFLLTHFYEDTLRTFIDVYLNDQTRSFDKECLQHKKLHLTNITIKHSFLRLINITDRFDVSCRMVNYLRYFLRFVSAYLILVFTIQRTIAIYWPFLESRLKSSKYAWFMISIITLIGIMINKWVPFFFGLTKDIHDPTISYCDINKEFSSAYFLLTIFYVTLTMMVPIFTIVVCNTLIIVFILLTRTKRENLMNLKSLKVNGENSISTVPSQSSFRSNRVTLYIVNKKSNTLATLRKIKERGIKKKKTLIELIVLKITHHNFGKVFPGQFRMAEPSFQPTWLRYD
ncbi:G-coupled receptor -like protein [Brachionus plicatilis]|uniref:G-coupled receptor-like protein n=1 Tax=Brachionus plicatilis TaxID=10195 RepID=A0A3M7PQ21_BRAPC|nr:G-coupled receptor -like protein [Brachionus plicatilis]